MTREWYRYAFDPQVRFSHVLDTLNLALVGIESLHGEARVRLDASFGHDPPARAVFIDSSTTVGTALNTLFAGFATREFGSDSFTVVRDARPHTSPHAPAKKGHQ